MAASVSLVLSVLALVVASVAFWRVARMARTPAPTPPMVPMAVVGPRYRIRNVRTREDDFTSDDGAAVKARWRQLHAASGSGHWLLLDRGVHRGTIYRPVMSGS